MNVFTFSGNLGSNSEQRVTQGGTEITQFSVAVRSGYGDNERTTWVRCSMFGKRGQSLAPYLVKGQQVVVSGEACLHTWTNRSGEEKTSLEVRVNDVTLVGGKPEQKAAPQQAPQPAREVAGNVSQQPGMNDFDDSDIPF